MDFVLGVKMGGPAEPVLLYAHPSMDLLARQIVEKCGKPQPSGYNLAPPDMKPVGINLLIPLLIKNNYNFFFKNLVNEKRK